MPVPEHHIRRGGFTLIEIAVVLLIIGLLVGTVFVGRYLIKAAEMRKTISQLEKYNVAVNTFRTKYACLPGDCASVNDFGFAASSYGTGDGIIGIYGSAITCDASDPDCQTSENSNFWYHLSAAGFIEQSIQDFYTTCTGGCPAGLTRWLATTAGYATPSVALKSVMPFNIAGRPPEIRSPGGWIVTATLDYDPDFSNVASPGPLDGANFEAHSFIMAAPWTTGTLGSIGETFPTLGGTVHPIYVGYAPADAYGIDVKIDDGLPTAGRAVAISRRAGGGPANLFNNLRSSNRPGAVPAEAFCVDDAASPPVYNVSYGGSPQAASFPQPFRAAGNCSLLIKATF